MARNANQARHGKAPSQRQLRVGEEIRHALSEVIRRAEFRDPVLAGRTITVTEVRVSPDLRNATVFVVPLTGDGHEVVASLRRASAYLRGQLSRSIKLRLMPALNFEYDDSFDTAARIETALHRPEVQRDLGPGDEGSGDESPGGEEDAAEDAEDED